MCDSLQAVETLFATFKAENCFVLLRTQFRASRRVGANSTAAARDSSFAPQAFWLVSRKFACSMPHSFCALIRPHDPIMRAQGKFAGYIYFAD